MATPLTYFTGIDLHKRSSFLTTLNSDGDVIEQRKINNHPNALRLYFRRHEGTHHAVVETTSGWYWLADTLRDEGVELALAHAKHLKAISYAKVKTDKVDSETLAHLLRTGLIPEAHKISDERRPLRDVLRTRLRLVERRTSAHNSVHRLLEKMNVADVLDLPEMMQLQARCHLDQIALLDEQIKALERALHPHLVPDPDVQRLLRIPGIGKINAFTIALEVDGIARFEDEGRFFSYCRLVPGAHDSGGVRRHKRGNKAGNRYLKLAFSHAAVRAVQYYPEIRAWYRSKKRKKPEAVARTLVAKEIARIAYHVLKKQEDFNGRFKGIALSRSKKELWPLLPSSTSITGKAVRLVPEGSPG